MHEFWRKLFAFYNFFPCPLCETGEGAGCNRICPDCLKKLPQIRGEHCPGCGGTLDTALAVCEKCLDAEARPWKDAASVFEYRDEVRKLIHDFKFNNHPELARPLGELMASEVKRLDFAIDLIVPLPLYYLRYLRRSFNQAELLGRILSQELGKPILPLLKRTRGGAHQAMLDRKRRQVNPRNVFSVSEQEFLKGKRVLLVDDVFTTGATLTSAAHALLKAEAGAVYVVTAARTQRYTLS